jgi:hypothetical protein
MLSWSWLKGCFSTERLPFVSDVTRRSVVTMADALLVNTAFCDVLCPFYTCNGGHILRDFKLRKASLTVVEFYQIDV